MTHEDFIHIFERQKRAFMVQNSVAESQSRVLELFGQWIKNSLPGTANNADQYAKNTGKREKDLGSLLDEIIMQANVKLAPKGIKIYCVYLDKTISRKQSSKCMRVFKDTDIYYRLYRRLPRKGKYKGQRILSMELVMDGYKSPVFLPLLEKKNYMESRIGLELERETQQMENTGKYRFKLCFPYRASAGEEYDVLYLGHMLGEFVWVTAECMRQLGIVAITDNGDV